MDSTDTNYATSEDGFKQDVATGAFVFDIQGASRIVIEIKSGVWRKEISVPQRKYDMCIMPANLEMSPHDGALADNFEVTVSLSKTFLTQIVSFVRNFSEMKDLLKHINK